MFEEPYRPKRKRLFTIINPNFFSLPLRTLRLGGELLFLGLIISEPFGSDKRDKKVNKQKERDTRRYVNHVDRLISFRRL
jgi:hypothetical protein